MLYTISGTKYFTNRNCNIELIGLEFILMSRRLFRQKVCCKEDIFIHLSWECLQFYYFLMCVTFNLVDCKNDIKIFGENFMFCKYKIFFY